MEGNRGAGPRFPQVGLAHLTSPSDLATTSLPSNCWPAPRRVSSFAMSTFAIKHMSWEEKLRAMEELWESLSAEDARLESPAWHDDALRETEQRYEAGQEQPVEWSTAKQELRERRR